MNKYFDRNKKTQIPLLLSLLYFVRKGIQYAAIGSWVPLVLVSVVLLSLLISYRSSENRFRIVARIWAVLLVIWSLIRIFISIIHLTVKPFDEAFHLTQQFGLIGLAHSILLLVLGILIYKGSKTGT